MTDNSRSLIVPASPKDDLVKHKIISTILQTAFAQTARCGGALPSSFDLGKDVAPQAKDRVLAALENNGFLETTSVQGGFFRVAAYALTVKGERALDHIAGRDSAVVEKELMYQTLRRLMRAKEDHGRVVDRKSFPEMAEHVGPARVEGVLRTLVRKGFLKTTSMPSGMMSVGGYALTTEGERALDRMEGRDTEAMEDGLRQKIMLKLLEKDRIKKNAVIDADPSPEDAEQIGRARMKTIINDLVRTGLIKPRSMQQGYFNVGGYYSLTDEGREFAEGLQRKTIRQQVQKEAAVVLDV